MSAPQTYANHSRIDPKFHFVAMPLLLFCVIASIVHVVHNASPANVLLVPLSIATLLVAAITRLYAMKVQDRVIRLEELVRMQRLAVSPEGLTLRQIIALRFAADGEFPALAARAVSQSLTPKQIKQSIVHWRADDERV